MIHQDYEYKAKIINVVDGDTIDVIIDLGFYVTTEQRMRLNGLDTPELNSKDEIERSLAQIAKIYLNTWKGLDVTIKSYKKDKYGRFLADVYDKNGIFLNKALIDLGYAVPYFGGPRGL